MVAARSNPEEPTMSTTPAFPAGEGSASASDAGDAAREEQAIAIFGAIMMQQVTKIAKESLNDSGEQSDGGPSA